MSLALSVCFQSAKASDLRKPVIPIDIPKMPVRIYSSSMERISNDISELSYALVNRSGEEIKRIDLWAFVVDARGQIVHSEVGVNREGVKDKERLESSMQVSRQLKKGERVYLCVSGALGKTGRWRVDSDRLKNLKVISSTKDLGLIASFEHHLHFTAQDKSEIISLVLADLAQDKAKRALIGEPLIVRTDDLDINLLAPAGNDFLFLSSVQITDLAQTNGTLKYLWVESLEAEGSSAQVRISLREQPSQYPVMRVRLTHTFVFSCTRQSGRWEIEQASGLLSSGL
jgi:hypothetical protein